MKKEHEFYQVELMYSHLGVLLIFLILCYNKMPFKIGHVEEGLKDQIYTSLQLHSIRKNNYTSHLYNNICSKIKELGIKRIFRGKEEEIQAKNMGPKQRCPQPIAQIITQAQYIILEREEHKILANKYTNYHKQTAYGSTSHVIRNIDIGFITETWINNTID